MKIKYIISCAAVIGIMMFCSISSLAATKVNFSLHYTGTGVGNTLDQSRSIEANSKRYRGYCTMSSGYCQLKLHVPGATDQTIDQGHECYFKRTQSSNGNMTVSAQLLHGSGSGGANGYIEKK